MIYSEMAPVCSVTMQHSIDNIVKSAQMATVADDLKIDFLISGDFRCILGTIFTVQLFGVNAKASSRG